MRFESTKKQDIFGSLDWVTKSKSCTRRNSDCDVSISLTAPRTPKKPGVETPRRVSFVFRNDTASIITTTGYLVYAVSSSANVMYFRESNSSEGYKLIVKNSKCGNAYLVIDIPDSMLDTVKNLIGDYELRFDAVNKLYYVGKEN